MVDLKLDLDEGILLQTTNVNIYDENVELEVYELYLTNKNLICVYDQSSEMFSENIVVNKIPLSSIRIINGVVQIQRVDDDDYGDCLQVIYKNGRRQLIELNIAPKKAYPMWLRSITDAILEFNKREEFDPKKSYEFIYCVNCGEKLPSYSKFCNVCGTPTINKDQTNNKKMNSDYYGGSATDNSKNDDNGLNRKQEYAGKIIKCPSCGAQLKSFTAVCPECGHEINSQNVSSTINDFIDLINEVDEEIARDKPMKTGFKSWNIFLKILWILLNFITVCIPLLFYWAFGLIKPFLFPKKSSDLTFNEKKKVSLIENYIFPNEREAILEAMIYCKSKMDFASAKKINVNTLFWINLWHAKAEQLNQKASLILKGDKYVEETYSEIQDTKRNIDKKVKSYALVGIIVIILLFGWIFFSGDSSSESNTNKTDYSVTYEWPTTGLSSYLPKPSTEFGKIIDDNETRFSIDLYNVTIEEFESYVKECKNSGFTLYTTKTDTTYYSYNDDEYSLDIFYDQDDQEMDLFLDAPKKMTDIYWPSSDIANLLPVPEKLVGNIWSDTSDSFGVYIDDTNQTKFSEYVDKCLKAGFNVDYSRSEDFFKGYNKKGYELTLRLQNFDVMSIYIDNGKE